MFIFGCVALPGSILLAIGAHRMKGSELIAISRGVSVVHKDGLPVILGNR
jgi:hypothetical protein